MLSHHAGGLLSFFLEQVQPQLPSGPCFSNSTSPHLSRPRPEQLAASTSITPGYPLVCSPLEHSPCKTPTQLQFPCLVPRAYVRAKSQHPSPNRAKLAPEDQLHLATVHRINPCSSHSLATAPTSENPAHAS